MKKLFAILFVLAIGFSVQADTITYSDSVTGLFDLVADRDLVIPQFDSSLGTLNSVTLNLSTALQASLGFENLKRFAGGNFDVYTYNSTDTTYAQLVMGFNGTLILMSSYTDAQKYTVTLAAYDGATDYAGTSGTTVATLGDADSLPLFYNSGLAQFIGIGNLLFSILTDASASLKIPSNSAAIINTTGQAFASITYDYTPVPEPATIAILSLGGLLFRRKTA